jgi:hypothetical protein
VYQTSRWSIYSSDGRRKGSARRANFREIALPELCTYKVVASTARQRVVPANAVQGVRAAREGRPPTGQQEDGLGPVSSVAGIPASPARCRSPQVPTRAPPPILSTGGYLRFAACRVYRIEKGRRPHSPGPREQGGLLGLRRVQDLAVGSNRIHTLVVVHGVVPTATADIVRVHARREVVRSYVIPRAAVVPLGVLLAL